MTEVSLAPQEIQRLEEGLPHLGRLSACILVPFEGRKLTGATVIWLNRRWFLERGLDVDEPSTRARIDGWLLSEFAFVADTKADIENRNGAVARTLYADRYGSTGGTSPHGGSGRVATAGKFQVKGVGITPLVGTTRQAGHAHGCLSLAEALREAILAELADREFPHGAVPTIAVIATGQRFTSPDISERFDQNVQRALSVRPAVVRLAHAERAPGFQMGVTGYSNSPIDDARRTEDVVLAWQTAKPERSQPACMLPLAELVTNVARQAAFGYAHRFSCGGFFSSNITACGNILDFGNAHVLPNWSNALVLPHAPGFGSEMKGVQAIIKSLSSFFRKYGAITSDDISPETLMRIAKSAYARQLEVEWARLWGEDGGGSGWISEAMSQYCAIEQKSTSLYRLGEVVSSLRRTQDTGNLHEALVEAVIRKRTHGVDRPAADYSGESSRAFANRMLSNLEPCHVAAAFRYLKPRTSVDRAMLLRTLHDLFEDADILPENSAVGD